MVVRYPLAVPTSGAGTRSSTDRASDYGSEGWEFESLRVRQQNESLISGNTGPASSRTCFSSSQRRPRSASIWTNSGLRTLQVQLSPRPTRRAAPLGSSQRTAALAPGVRSVGGPSNSETTATWSTERRAEKPWFPQTSPAAPPTPSPWPGRRHVDNRHVCPRTTAHEPGLPSGTFTWIVRHQRPASRRREFKHSGLVRRPRPRHTNHSARFRTSESGTTSHSDIDGPSVRRGHRIEVDDVQPAGVDANELLQQRFDGVH